VLKEPYITRTNLPLTTSSGIHGPPISEYILLNWLVSSRNYHALYEAQKRHEWINARQYAPSGLTDHVGKKVAILGYGSIGRQGLSPPLSIRKYLAN
jgi:phosphoglycerate dehydrogenase-like enzyme